MRSFICLTILLAACAGAKPKAEPAKEFDPELAEACLIEDGFAPRHCVKGDDGTWTTATPPSNILLQGRKALEAGHYEAAVHTLTQAMFQEDACGKQFAVEQRGEAYFRLGRYKEAFQDFATIVRDGPENPFYATVGKWLDALAPHVDSGAMHVCRASYDPALLEPKAAPTE
jgi:tetratricopeptide (TPR) repeat protein